MLTAHRRAAGARQHAIESILSVKTYPSKINAGLVKLQKRDSGTRSGPLTIYTHYSGPCAHPNGPEADKIMRNADYLFPTRLRAEVSPVEADGVTGKTTVLVRKSLKLTRTN